MQKRSQKPQSLREKQRNHLKNARDCEEATQMLNKEMEERKAVCRNPPDASLIQPCGSRSSHLERHGQQVLSNLRSKILSGSAELQTLRSSGQEEKRKEIGKETVRMQMVEVAGEEIPVHGEMERMLETALVSRVGIMTRWRDPCDKGTSAGEHWQKEKSKKRARKRTQRPFNDTAREGTSAP